MTTRVPFVPSLARRLAARPTLAALPAAVAVALVLLPAVGHTQSDWAVCADEGQVCRFQGEAMVRFGVPGLQTFRVARNRVLCDVDEFGDPAPNRVKQCEVSLNWRQDARYRGWRDPNHGPAAAPASGEHWVLCASEGDTCRVPASTQVRYGAGGRYASRSAGAPLACTNAVFGDPVPGTAKQCEYLAPGSSTTTAGAGAAGTLVWQRCADEGGNCQPGAGALVRYGVEGRHAYRDVAPGQALGCVNDNFGGDPALNQRKACDVLRPVR
jgi:hypothetical protein